jgi:hypothetical protein
MQQNNSIVKFGTELEEVCENKMFMKKIIGIGLLTAIISTTANAQAVRKNDGGFQLVGGVNLANISVTDDGRVDDAKMLTSYRVGAIVDVPLGNFFSLQPGLLFTGKGAKTTVGNSTDLNYYQSTSNPMYIEMPFNFVGKLPLGEYSNLFFGAGPYAAMGVAGKNRVDGKFFGVKFDRESNIIFNNDNPTTSQEEDAGYGKLKRFDYGLNALGGLEFNKFSLSANYGMGFTKINSNTKNNANDEGKHRVLSLSLALKL